MFDTGQYELNHRQLGLLRAVAEGGAELLVGCEPDLAVKGAWCDHEAACGLLAYGLIRQVVSGTVGQLVPVELTELGHSVLASLSLRAA